MCYFWPGGNTKNTFTPAASCIRKNNTGKGGGWGSIIQECKLGFWEWCIRRPQQASPGTKDEHFSSLRLLSGVLRVQKVGGRGATIEVFEKKKKKRTIVAGVK